MECRGARCVGQRAVCGVAECRLCVERVEAGLSSAQGWLWLKERQQAANLNFAQQVECRDTWNDHGAVIVLACGCLESGVGLRVFLGREACGLFWVQQRKSERAEKAGGSPHSTEPGWCITNGEKQTTRPKGVNLQVR